MGHTDLRKEIVLCQYPGGLSPSRVSEIVESAHETQTAGQAGTGRLTGNPRERETFVRDGPDEAAS